MKKITFPAETFIDLVNTCESSISKEEYEYRKALKFINIKADCGHIKACSLDGYMLSIYEIESINQNVDEPFECFIKPIKIPKNAYQVTIELIDDYVELTVEEEFIKSKYYIDQPKEKYIDYEKIYRPEETNAKIALSAKKLIRLLKPYTKNFFSDKILISFDNEKKMNPIYIESLDHCTKAKSLLLPIRYIERDN